MNATLDLPRPTAAAAASAAPGWREDTALALLLAVAGAIATAMVLPYLLDLTPELRAKSPVSMPVLAALQALQGFVVCFVLALLGARMQWRAGLDAPWLRALVARRARPRVAWWPALGLGLLAGLAVVACSLVLDPHLPPPLHALHAAHAPAAPGAWHGLLASFYGGITEEIELRLFAMTGLLWLVAKATGRTPATGAYVAAIVLAALLFGAAHLPAASHVWALDAIVVVRTIALNALAGLVFGWLYWKRGFEAAIVAHFTADLVLHVATPLLPGLAA